MTAKQRKRFYQSGEWRSMSRRIRERDGWLCTACRPRTVGADCVHHVKPLSENGSALDPANLTSLCAQHHREAHGVVEDEQKRAWTQYIWELVNQF